MADAEELTVTVPGDIMEMVRARVGAGAYQSDGEIVRAAMRRWWERERKQIELEAAIEKGLADSRAGRTHDIEDVRARLIARYSNWKKAGSAA